MFGKSIFQSVLDRLEAQGEAEEAEVQPRSGIRGLNAGFAHETEASAGGDTVRQAYADMAGPDSPFPGPAPPPEPPPIPEPEPEPEPRPSHLHRLTPAEIADDLKLSDRETPGTLAEKRRVFAVANHPDRYPPHDRPAATTRMKIANMLVDEALRRLKRGLPPKAASAETRS